MLPLHPALSMNSFKMITVYFYTINTIHSMDVVSFLNSNFSPKRKLIDVYRVPTKKV